MPVFYSSGHLFELKFWTLHIYTMLDVPEKFQPKRTSFRFFRIFMFPGGSGIPVYSSGNPLELKICRDHLYIILGVPAKFQLKIPSITCFMGLGKKCPHFEHANV